MASYLHKKAPGMQVLVVNTSIPPNSTGKPGIFIIQNRLHKQVKPEVFSPTTMAGSYNK
jgi:hypothetical protein